MVEFLQLILLLGVLALTLATGRSKANDTSALTARLRRFAAKQGLVVVLVGCSAFAGCVAVASLLHEPVPRIHDEFSYLLMGETLASGRVSNPAPPLPEFFDTFHELIRPVYVSKYFPAQGVFLALGQKLTGHPAVGVWLSSALACAAVCWMLQAWAGPLGGLLGGSLIVVQLGIFSYWSQTYWGGMVATLGGALFFGAVRRLWSQLTWQNAFWLALGLVILANSRPMEGFLVVIPLGVLFLVRVWRERQWKTIPFWRNLLLPASVVLLLGAAATAVYNRGSTGSSWKPPYFLHEQQYQESPPFIFMPARARLIYSNPWLEYYFHVEEMGFYSSERSVDGFIQHVARKLATWWAFYFGVLLIAPAVVVGLLRRGPIRTAQLLVLLGLLILGATYDPTSTIKSLLIDVLALTQMGILWIVFDEFWEWIALVTLGLLVLDTLVVKVGFPHYSAPGACLIFFLHVQAFRHIWQYRSQLGGLSHGTTGAERKRAARALAQGQIAFPWRGFAFLLPLACVLSLGIRVEAPVARWTEDNHGPDRSSLPMRDWSLRRAELEAWLEQQKEPQLVFVSYSSRHQTAFEWVFNHADLPNSRVVWAHDLGADHNRLLLQQLPGRTVWSLKADSKEPQLVTYSEAIAVKDVASVETRPSSRRDSPDF